mgnify:CR=1 FL=1
MHIAKRAKDRVKIDTQKIREQLIQDLKEMFELAKAAVTAEGIKEKQAQHWIRVMGYIGQVTNSLTKTFDEAKALEYLNGLERMIRGEDTEEG